MKKATKIILGSVAAVAIVMGISGLAIAKYGGHSGMMGDYMIYKLEKELDLNDLQVSQLQSIQQYVKNKHDQHPHEDHKAQIKTMLSAPVLDQQQIMTMIDTKMQAMRSHAPEMISRIAGFTDSLTPEQRTELIEMMDKRGFGRHHRHGEHTLDK